MGVGPLHRIVPGSLIYDTQIPGQPGQSGRDDGEHPSGLFWFHPHTHGYSAALTAGGTTGLITIGELSDYVCVETAGDCGPPSTIPVRTLVLKDAELLPDHNGWRLSHDRVYALEDVCAQSSGRDDERLGECHDYRGRRWLFTVNGARYPSIDDAVGGRPEVWRIVNASPNMSYRLRLRPLDGGGTADALPLRVLTLEGAAPAPSRTIAPGVVRELLLMPASRAEIVIVPPLTGGAYVLEQQPFTTGGDNWPHALLAELHASAATTRSTTADPAAGIRLRGATPTSMAPQRFFADTAEPACDYPSGSVRRILLVARPSFSDDRRRPTKFGLIAGLERSGSAAELFDAEGKPRPMTRQTWNGLLAQDPDAPAFMHNPFGTVCTYVGHTETWIIDNYTAEAHNFHIHQTEFRLAEAHRNDSAFFSPEPANGLGALQRTSDAAIAMADEIDRTGGAASFYRDTVPVPRGVSSGSRGCDGSPFNEHCRPGRVTLIIRFDRDAQVGTFVYHCHILQHEDAGMMAVIRVLCPPDDRACAARHPQPPAPAMIMPAHDTVTALHDSR
jgi:FtsP/CotA-like multicopper oxidase with cupredoxin domain